MQKPNFILYLGADAGQGDDFYRFYHELGTRWGTFFK